MEVAPPRLLLRLLQFLQLLLFLTRDVFDFPGDAIGTAAGIKE